MPSACGTLDKLPAEVRENIYAELFCRARAILEKPGPKGVSPSTEKYLSAISIKYGAALLQTCRLIHNEARPFLAMYLHVDVRLIRNIGFTALFPKSSFYAQKLRILTVAYEDVNGFYINYCFPQLQLLYLVGKPGAAPDQQGYEIKCSRDDTDADRQGYVYGSIDNELIRRTLAGFYGDRRFSRLKAEFDGFLGHLKIYQSFYLCLQWPNLGAEFHRAWIVSIIPTLICQADIHLPRI